jgi:hypothetical protein
VPAKIIAKWLPYEDAIALRDRLAAAPGVAQRRFRIELHTPEAVRGALGRPGDVVVHRIRGPEQTRETGCTVFRVYWRIGEVTAVSPSGICGYRDHLGRHSGAAHRAHIMGVFD